MPYRTPGVPAPPGAISLNDPDTWPPHEVDLTSTDVRDDGLPPCVADCTRCQLIVLAEERDIDDRPYDFVDDPYILHERINELEKLVKIPARGPTRVPRCRYSDEHVTDDTGTCIYCGAAVP